MLEVRGTPLFWIINLAVRAETDGNRPRLSFPGMRAPSKEQRGKSRERKSAAFQRGKWGESKFSKTPPLSAFQRFSFSAFSPFLLAFNTPMNYTSLLRRYFVRRSQTPLVLDNQSAVPTDGNGVRAAESRERRAESQALRTPYCVLLALSSPLLALSLRPSLFALSSSPFALSPRTCRPLKELTTRLSSYSLAGAVLRRSCGFALRTTRGRELAICWSAIGPAS